MYVREPHKDERLQDSQLGLICHHELRKRGEAWGFEGRRRFTGRWEERMFESVCVAPAEGHLNQQALPPSVLASHGDLLVTVLSGWLSWTRPSKFLEAVSREVNK